jgi:hypothetical protein
MYLVREIMHCRPGKASELVKRFKAMEPIMKEMGVAESQRVLTDMSGERFWTVVAEQAVGSIEDYLQMSRKIMTDPRAQQVMQGYHEFVESGRREIYKIE